MGQPDLDILFALLLFGPSLLALGFGVWCLISARRFSPASPWREPGPVLDYAQPDGSEPRRATKVFFWFVCIVPTTLFALSAAALAEAYVALGRWPQPLVDSVTPLGEAAFVVNIGYLLLQPLLVPAVILGTYRMRRNRMVGRGFRIYGLASLASFTFLWFGPLAPWVIGD